MLYILCCLCRSKRTKTAVDCVCLMSFGMHFQLSIETKHHSRIFYLKITVIIAVCSAKCVFARLYFFNGISRRSCSGLDIVVHSLKHFHLPKFWPSCWPHAHLPSRWPSVHGSLTWVGLPWVHSDKHSETSGEVGDGISSGRELWTGEFSLSFWLLLNTQTHTHAQREVIRGALIKLQFVTSFPMLKSFMKIPVHMKEQ